MDRCQEVEPKMGFQCSLPAGHQAPLHHAHWWQMRIMWPVQPATN